MPDLLEVAAPLQAQFAVSLPHSLLATVSLMCAAPRFEGLGDWLQETRARLPADLREELCILIGFPGRYERFNGELLARLPAHTTDMSFEELTAHLGALPDVHFQIMALRALARATTPSPSPTELLELLDRPGEWAAYLTAAESEVASEEVAALIRDGGQVKGRLLAALERFWQLAYAEEFRATRPLMERSVAYHQSQGYTTSFGETFTTVTGRLLPEPIAKLLPTTASITFMPSCYVGPYVAYTRANDHLYIFYNCRSIPGAPTAVDGASLYPPLKALADETRLQILTLLQGRELYAQEIVDRLGISQPAVSRHLNLMAAAGVLKIRREGNSKYYAVDGDTLARLADALRTLA